MSAGCAARLLRNQRGLESRAARVVRSCHFSTVYEFGNYNCATEFGAHILTTFDHFLPRLITHLGSPGVRSFQFLTVCCVSNPRLFCFTLVGSLHMTTHWKWANCLRLSLIWSLTKYPHLANNKWRIKKPTLLEWKLKKSSGMILCLSRQNHTTTTHTLSFHLIPILLTVHQLIHRKLYRLLRSFPRLIHLSLSARVQLNASVRLHHRVLIKRMIPQWVCLQKDASQAS